MRRSGSTTIRAAATPSRDLLGNALAELEQGAGAAITASGMAAVALALELVPAGALVLAAHDCYGGTWRLFEAVKKGRIRVRYANSPIRWHWPRRWPSSRRWCGWETPSNLLRVTDIRHVAQAAHAVGALVLVDNTFLSPALQQPLTLGADLVLHSTTKYINGHSDVVGGAVIARTPELAQQLTWWANCNGLTGAPFDAFLNAARPAHPGATRLRAHQESAAAVVELLSRHEAVAKVYYLGLADHPQHWPRASKAASARWCRSRPDADVAGIEAFVTELRCFSLAESLGGVESLVAHPATMTHAAMAPEAPQRMYRRQSAAPVRRHRGRARPGGRSCGGAGLGRRAEAETGAGVSAVVVPLLHDGLAREGALRRTGARS